MPWAGAAPFQHRHRLDARADGQRAMTLLLASGLVTEGERPAWQQAAERALASLVAAFDAMQPLASLRLHGDCHLGNVLWRFHGESPGPHVVDLDDAMQGPAVQDLWMLVSGDHHTMAAQLDQLLGGYEQFCEFDDRERSADRTAAHPAHAATQRLAGRALERPDLPAELPALFHAGLLVTADGATARTARTDGRGLSSAHHQPGTSGHQQAVDALHVGRRVFELPTLGQQAWSNRIWARSSKLRITIGRGAQALDQGVFGIHLQDRLRARRAPARPA
jgi:Ser/Thr protein kinase RdoA (MazF antagonist)